MKIKKNCSVKPQLLLFYPPQPCKNTNILNNNNITTWVLYYLYIKHKYV